jgi:prepilin-type N-terminal cleavage/methylation domain-containing protein
MRQKIKQNNRGFTLIEVIVTIGIFALLAVSMLGTISALSRTTKSAREKVILSSLATNYLEVVRNMPYSQVGTMTGNPNGSLPDCPLASRPTCPKAFSQTIEGVTYKIFYEAQYIDDPADGVSPADVAPGDYKQVKMSILNIGTNQITNFLTTVVPKGVETSANSGVLLIKVLNAQGQPLPGANIHIQYPTSTGATLNIDRLSDSSGNWEEPNLTPGVNAYRIVVTKSGYSSDQTYPITAANPNPTKPDATIIVNKATQITFSIDLLSNLTIKTLDATCIPINNVGMNVRGAKLIGTSPNVYKFDQNFYSGPAAYPNGQIVLTGIEWDTYTPLLLASQPYTVRGTSPIQKVDVLPGTSQTFTFILDVPTTHSLLVIVKDAVTLAPLEGASVTLQKGGSTPQTYTGVTGGSVWSQNDWSEGSGFSSWSTSTPNVYFQDFGNIYVNNGSNNIELRKISGKYIVNSTSTLESATFDTGTSLSNFTTLTWSPASQDPMTFLGLQMASNNDNSTWNYVGPDGTNQTYYTVPGTNISSALDNNRYVRYKVFLRTTDDRKAPVLSALQINYVSGCFTPGQVFFPGLTPTNGVPYTLTITLPGYTTKVVSGIMISGNQSIEVSLN